MSYVSVGGILDDLKQVYEQAKPTIKMAKEAYKEGKSGGEGVFDEPAPSPEPPGGGSGNGLMYAGIGLAVLAIFYFGSKR